MVFDSPNVLKTNLTSSPPLGMLYIGEVLRQEGHSVKICDQESQKMTPFGVLNWIKKFNPEILGFGPYEQSLASALDIARQAKKWNENLTIVFGNMMGTFADKQLLSNYSFIDYCLRRETEFTFPKFVDLVTGVIKKDNLDEVKGLSYRSHGVIKRTPDPPLLRNLDVLPIPDREALCDFEYKIGTNKFTLMASSRGCPFNCNFCAIGLVSNSRMMWRPRSLKNVLSELHFLESRGYKEIGFVDDDINANPKRTLELCQQMRREKVDLTWTSEGRVNYASKELLSTMKSAGCNTVLFGIEAVTQRILDFYNKKITPVQSALAIRNARKAGIDNIIGLFIVGAPQETVSEVIQTIKFSLKLDLTANAFHLLYIPIQSNLWQLGVKMKVINEERDWNRRVYAADVFPDTVRRDVLERLISWAGAAFFSNPKFLLKEIFRSVKSQHRLQILLNFLKDLF